MRPLKEGSNAGQAAKGVVLLASPRLLCWLLPCIIILSVAGTLVPQCDIYHSGPFAFLLGLLSLNLVLCTWQRQVHVRLRPDVLLTHISILMVLAGGMVTAIAGRRGSLSLNVGETKDAAEGKPGFPLPFSVKLEDFRIEYYGSGLAAGPVKQFRSEVAVVDGGRIAARRAVEVNKPLRWKGYTLYQAGYDPDNPGYSILLVSHDPGVPVVYAGFLLLMAGLAGTFLRGLVRRP